MADESEAQAAYLLAVERIRHVVAMGDLEMYFVGSDFKALEAIPHEIEEARQITTLHILCPKVMDISALSHLTRLTDLIIESYWINDISALSGLHALHSLRLASIGNGDISALRFLSNLESLNLADTTVDDISPMEPLRRSLRSLNLDHTWVTDITALSLHKGLQHLSLKATAVMNLDPLSIMSGLATLDISGTTVHDITIVSSLPALQSLDLTDSQVVDLRPLRDHPSLGRRNGFGLRYDSTPAIEKDATLAALAKISDNLERTEKTLAYLKTLPRLPKPLPWLDPPKEPIPPITVETILQAQTPFGWRFSPEAGAMVIHVEDRPLSSLQDQLSAMARERAEKLGKSLKGANHGLRGEARIECERFEAIIGDGARPLAVRSVELWGSLVALGGLLEASELGRIEQRDPLDLLASEQRAALQTLLQIAGNLVRSFPEARALDDTAGGFLRREPSVEMVLAMVEASIRAAFVSAGSAALMQHVAAVAKGSGAQAEKAASVSVQGIANLIRAAAVYVVRGGAKLTMAAAVGAAGAAGAVTGKELAEHYQTGKAAIAFIQQIEEWVEPFLSTVPPDQAADLRAAIHDARNAFMKAPDKRQLP